MCSGNTPVDALVKQGTSLFAQVSISSACSTAVTCVLCCCYFLLLGGWVALVSDERCTMGGIGVGSAGAVRHRTVHFGIEVLNVCSRNSE